MTAPTNRPRYNLLRNPVTVIAEWIWARLAAGMPCAVHVEPSGAVHLRPTCRKFRPFPDAWLVAIYRASATLQQIVDDLSARLAEICSVRLLDEVKEAA